MQTIRRYTISGDVAPGEPKPPEDTLSGGFWVHAHDAAKNYVGLYLGGYAIVSCRFVKVQMTDKHGLHSLWKCECVNNDKQLGATLWVREL